MRAHRAVVAERAATLIAGVLARGVVLGLRQPTAQPRAALQVGVERVQAVRAKVAKPDITQDRPDDPADIALMRQAG
jgi:hypothetical protein